MDFANVAEFRQNAARVFARLQRDGEVVILRNGRPIGLLLAADAANLDDLRVAAARVRAKLALERLRRDAARRGLDRHSMDDIDAVIRKARRQRAARR